MIGHGEPFAEIIPEPDAEFVAGFEQAQEGIAAVAPQPVTERGYSTYVPGRGTPFENVMISTMAQVYPEDRGTNYAIREGNQVADTIVAAAA